MSDGRSRRRVQRTLQGACACWLLAGATACARDGLLLWSESDAGSSEVDLDASIEPDAPDPVLPDAELPQADGATECVPAEEQCNGVDDDCDGAVDELPPIPCAGGGSRYCVAGRMSECPMRCEVCRPGTDRVCFLSYCTYWATQTCAADGRGFGRCRERLAPPECEHLIEGRLTRALEQCCIDNGYCCVDHFDLDNDGRDDDMVGRCEDVVCR